MRDLLVIARKDLRQRFRDRSALIVAVIAPLAVAALMSVSFKGAETFHMSVGLVVKDNGALATAFHDVLTSQDLRAVVSVHEIAGEQAAAKRVKDHKLDAAFVVPANFTADTFAGRAATIQVLSNVDARIAGQVATSIASSFASQVNADRLSVATAIAAGAPVASLPSLQQAAQQLRLPEQAVRRPTGAKDLTALSYYAPSMAVFFAMFSVGFAARSFFNERREGMLDRMSAAPLRPTTILVGKVLSIAVYGLGSLLTVLLITGLFFRGDWGNPLGVFALCAAMTASICALAALVIGLARTEEQAQSLSSILVFGLAVLGGNFVNISAEPAFMRRLSLLTPNGWALRGFIDGSTGADSFGHIVVPVVAMLTFTVVVGAIALWRAPKAVAA